MTDLFSLHSQHRHDDVLQHCIPGYDAAAALRLLPRVPRTGERRPIRQHHESARLHLGAVRCRNPHQSLHTKILPPSEKGEQWQRHTGTMCCQSDSEGSCLTCPQAGLSILIISSIVVSVLSAVAVKGVLWMIVMPDVLLVAALMPLIGFMLGYFMSVACKLSAQWVVSGPRTANLSQRF